MEKKVTYIANNGKEFDNETDCYNYEKEIEREEENKVLKEIVRLDLKIWKKYYPDYDENNSPELYQASLWLNTDIENILCEFPNSFGDITNIIKKSEFCDIIMNKYLHLDKIMDSVRIRRNFGEALRSVKRGSELSHILGFAFNKTDISNLAKLHRSNKYRKKIEDLLTDCNFHYECGKFIEKEYEEFII